MFIGEASTPTNYNASLEEPAEVKTDGMWPEAEGIYESLKAGDFQSVSVFFDDKESEHSLETTTWGCPRYGLSNKRKVDCDTCQSSAAVRGNYASRAVSLELDYVNLPCMYELRKLPYLV